ncbi:intraflagellar transport protein 81 homolog isoform X2 [Ixodes scapularis]|nr:intraflagellar transport protein 81 homolog isoform X2 [Ixodes scapularis]XP_040071552.1 intraflagellar transport protein 81 homolog isoform X2 [Ixodes scapularis]
MPELRKRAYLARFLVRVELHPELEGDADLVALYSQYEALMEQFKEVHKISEALKGSGFNTQEVRKDIGHMEEEKEQLLKKIARLRRRVDVHSNKDAMLELARNLREEQDKADTLSQQRMNQQDALNHCEQKIQRLTQQLRDLRQSGLGATPEGLLQRLEEELRANGYLVRDKLPKEIAACQDAIRDLQKVATEPAMGQSDIDKIKAKIHTENAEINALYEQKMRSQETTDDKLTLFRQQAAVIARKKEAAGETLNELRVQLNQLESELKEKQSQISAEGGEEVLKGEDFKKYVGTLRGKSTTYKEKRQELAELRAETGVLARTAEILQQKQRELTRELEVLEDQKGVRGYHALHGALQSASGQKASLDDRKNATLEDMAAMVTSLNSRITDKKGRLAPIIKDLRPLRKSCQDLTIEYEKKKSTYDSCAAGLESNLSRLEQEVTSLRNELNAQESKSHFLQLSLQIHEAQLKFLEANGALEPGILQADGSAKKLSLRDRLNQEISEQEKEGKALRERQKQVREGQDALRNQALMWKHLERLLRSKTSSGAQREDGQLQEQASGDMLVL